MSQASPSVQARFRLVIADVRVMSAGVICVTNEMVAALVALIRIPRRYCSGSDRVAGRDICDKLLGERGVGLAHLTVDRDLFLILRGGDLAQVQSVAHDTSTVAAPGTRQSH
jgi:hypothetical protein